jgi:hypothetical protein
VLWPRQSRPIPALAHQPQRLAEVVLGCRPGERSAIARIFLQRRPEGSKRITLRAVIAARAQQRILLGFQFSHDKFSYLQRAGYF